MMVLCKLREIECMLQSLHSIGDLLESGIQICFR